MVAKTRKKPAAKRTHERARKTRMTGVMRADEVLTVDAFCQRFGCTRAHVVNMRRAGLIVRAESEKNLRILGSDYHAFLASRPVAEIKSGGTAEQINAEQPTA